MKLKEMLTLCNNELKTLEGVKFKSATEFHELKDNALYEVANELGLKVGLWDLTYRLGNDIVYESDVPVFKMVSDIKKDKRYKTGFAGQINKVELIYAENCSMNMEDYAEVDLEKLNSFYIIDNLKHAIKSQEEKINVKLAEIEEEKKWMLKYHNELERIQKEVDNSEI